MFLLALKGGGGTDERHSQASANIFHTALS